jgi:hypothetical protein
MFKQTIAVLAVFLCGAWLLLADRNRDDARNNNSLRNSSNSASPDRIPSR